MPNEAFNIALAQDMTTTIKELLLVSKLDIDQVPEFLEREIFLNIFHILERQQYLQDDNPITCCRIL